MHRHQSLPDHPCSPGEAIRAEVLRGFGINQTMLADALGISAPRLSMVLKGTCLLTPEIALRLERVTAMPASYWMRIRADYELYQNRMRLSDQLKRLRSLSRTGAS